jgi:signal transduction histidine kinase
MDGLLGKTAGRTLRESKGSPQGASQRAGATIGLALGPALAAMAFGVSMLALVDTQIGHPESGVDSETPGGRVLAVSVGSIGWNDGIRPDQEVISLRSADEPRGWQIVTSDPKTGAQHLSQDSTYTAALRGSWPIAVLGVVLALGAVVAASRRRMEMLAALAITASAIPTELRGQPVLSPFVSILAVLAPTLWLTRWARMPRPIHVLVVGVSISLIPAWMLAAAIASESYGSLDDLRRGYGVGLAGAIIVARPGMLSRRTLDAIRNIRGLDLVVAALLVTLAVVLQAIATIPLFVSAIVAFGAAVLYSRWRGVIVGALDRAFLGDVRERASLDAIESERSRLARDIHDEPLQQLAGVIKRLEARPDTVGETDLLRSVADQLRSVATELHPPVLDDLGLAPSIEFIAARQPVDVQVAVDVPGGLEYAASGRPPVDVELAVFRIVQEALANAVQHASCTEISIEGSVAAGQIDLRIVDDGVGFSDREMSRAMRDGRLGLVSMRRRAEAIDADLDIEARPGVGTTVSVRWSA